MQIIEIKAVIKVLISAGDDLPAVFAEVVKCCRDAVLDALGGSSKALHVLKAKHASTVDQLIFQTIDADGIVHRSTNAVYITGCLQAFKDQRAAGNLGQINDSFFVCIQVNIAQVHIAKFTGCHFAQLFLHTTATLDGIFQDLTGFLLGHPLIGIDQFGQTGEGSTDSNGVTGVKVTIQRKILTVRIGKIISAHCVAEFCKAIGDQTITRGKQIGAQLRCLPTGQIRMNSIKECRVVIKCLGEGFKQIGGTHHIRNATESVAFKCNGCIGTNGIRASCEAAVCHIVLHNLHHITGCLGNTRHLIKCDAIPVANKAYTAGCHIVEHIGYSGSATTHQDRIGGKFTIGMRLAGATGAKFNQVIVFLNKRHKAQQIMQLFLLAQFIRFITGATQHQGDPLVLGKILTSVLDLIQIQIGHLDWLQGCNFKRRLIARLSTLDLFLFLLIAEDIFFCTLVIIVIFFIKTYVLDLYNTPNTANQQLFIMYHQIGRHFKGVHPQIGKPSNILILTVIKGDRDFINNRILAVFLNLGFYILTLVRAHIVLTQNTLDLGKTHFNGILVIGSAIHTQQIFQYIGRNICALLHQCSQIFSNDFSREYVDDFTI